MSRTWGILLQTALVIALFLGSLAAVLFNTFQSLILPQRDFGIRERLRASQRMAIEGRVRDWASGDGGQSAIQRHQ